MTVIRPQIMVSFYHMGQNVRGVGVMATLIALLLALAVYTLTVYFLNVEGSPVGAQPSWDILTAFNIAADQYGTDLLKVPDPFNLVIAVGVLILPAIIVFSVVRIIVK